LIIPTRWYAGGKGLDSFRDAMLNDIRIKELHDCLRPEEIFPYTNNRGGVCYFLWDQSYDNIANLTKVVTHDYNNESRTVNRSLKTRDLDIFIRDSQSITILNKVISDSKTDNLSHHISAAKAFGFRTFFIKDKKFRSTKTGLKEPVLCYGRAGKIGFVEFSDITSHIDWVNLWKVYVPESNNIGTELSDDNQNSFVGGPYTVCTETYLVVGAELHLTELSASNLVLYLRTKFARYLHSLPKISQHGTKKTYRFVPLQDFTTSSDIDWSQSIDNIDEQLFVKYGLTNDEKQHIRTSIKEMA